jgi:hypothetical protein
VKSLQIPTEFLQSSRYYLNHFLYPQNPKDWPGRQAGRFGWLGNGGGNWLLFLLASEEIPESLIAQLFHLIHQAGAARYSKILSYGKFPSPGAMGMGEEK